MFELVDLISGCTLIRKSGGGPHSQNANILKVNNLQVVPRRLKLEDMKREFMECTIIYDI